MIPFTFEEHFAKYIGPIHSVFHEILSDLIHVDVHYIKPSEKHNYHTLFTTGMSYLPMSTPERLEEYQYAELVVCLPPDWPISDEALRDNKYYWPIRWLKMLARFPHEYETLSIFTRSYLFKKKRWSSSCNMEASSYWINSISSR